MFLFGQELELQGTYSVSTFKRFQNNFGCGIGYNHFLTPRNRLGFFINYYMNSILYHDSYTSTSDLSRIVKDVQPHNQQVAIKINYSYNLLKSIKSMLFIGAELGLNYFIINEKGEQTVTTRWGNTSSGDYSSNYSVNNRIGVGMLIEYELKNIILKRISTSISLHPEITSYRNFGLTGTSDPALIGWLNFNIGIKYSLTKNR